LISSFSDRALFCPKEHPAGRNTNARPVNAISIHRYFMCDSMDKVLRSKFLDSLLDPGTDGLVEVFVLQEVFERFDPVRIID
jgi:hypothetical protein